MPSERRSCGPTHRVRWFLWPQYDARLAFYCVYMYVYMWQMLFCGLSTMLCEYSIKYKPEIA